jgi:hypothetical protein
MFTIRIERVEKLKSHLSGPRISVFREVNSQKLQDTTTVRATEVALVTGYTTVRSVCKEGGKRMYDGFTMDTVSNEIQIPGLQSSDA